MPYRVAIGPSSFAQEDQTPLKTMEAAGIEVVPNPFGRRLTEEEIIEHLKGIDGLIAVLLTLCRQVLPANAALHNGEWKKVIGRGLAGTKVLLVGYGRIGRRVGEILRALGSELVVFDPFLEENGLDSGETLVSTLAEGLTQASIVSLHSSGTELLFDAAAFEAMSEGTILLNSARGELVDEDAMTRALDSGKVAGAWFDAFVEEPYSGPLTQYGQVILTPHMSTYSRADRT